MDRAPEIDLAEAKAQVFAYCKKRGARLPSASPTSSSWSGWRRRATGPGR